MTPPTSHESSEYRMSIGRTTSRDDLRIRPSPCFSDDDRSLTLDDAMTGNDLRAMMTSPPGSLDAHLRRKPSGDGFADMRKDVQSTPDMDIADRRRAAERQLKSRKSYHDARSLGDMDAARKRTNAVLRANDAYGGRSSSEFDDVKSMGDLSKVSMDTQQLAGLTPQELARIRLKKQQKMAMRRQAEKVEGENFADQPSLGAFLSSQNDRYESDDVPSLGDRSDKSSDNDTFMDMFKWSSRDDEDSKPSAASGKSVGAATAPAATRKRGSIGATSRSTSGGDGGLGGSGGSSSRRSSSRRGSTSSSKYRRSRSVGGPLDRPKSRSSGILTSHAPDAHQTRRSTSSYADGLYVKDDDSWRGMDPADMDKILDASNALGSRGEESRRSRSTTKSKRRSKSAADIDVRSRRSRRDERTKKSKSRSRNRSGSRARRDRDDDGSIISRDTSKRASSRRRKSSGEKERTRSSSRYQKSPKSPKSPNSKSPRRSSEDDRSKTSRDRKESRKSSRSKSRRQSDGEARRSGSKVKRSKSKKRSSSRNEDLLVSSNSNDRRGYDSTYDSQYDTTNEGGFRPEDSFSTFTKDTDADNSGRSNVIQNNGRRGTLSKVASEETIEVEQEILLQFHPCTPGNTEKMKIASMNSSFVRINNNDGSSSHRMILEMPSTDQLFPPDRGFSDSKTVSSVASNSKMASDAHSEASGSRGRKKMIGVMKGAKDLMDRARSKSRGPRSRHHRARSRSLRRSGTEGAKSCSGETQACSDDEEVQLLSGRMSSCENEEEAPMTPRSPRKSRSVRRSRTKTQ
eukprot:CAMPEP_0194037738 /NCGR_PEP_ID=MMETSP0009_2-20130614/10059_1 /TAXON_ID=210454 /ORGANISM="Grammatophora oceanica, Strain CCMP 410" /LENGTH=797 /DNA_ID=CAMNT_0038680001 /DNA_START=111 /DNA_END=2504 /DNA_ORIENTATION=+